MKNPKKDPPQPLTEQESGQLDNCQYTLSQSDEVEILDEVTFKRDIERGINHVEWERQISKQRETAESTSLVGVDVKKSPPNNIIEQSLIEISSSAQHGSINSSGESQIIDKSQQISERLCCRSYFIKGQQLCPESRSIEFKNYNMSCLNPHLELIIGKAICAFLNSNGGTVLIGVRQTEDFQRFVVGKKYTQMDKENIYRKLRELAQTIKPDIIASQLFEIGFVPIVYQRKGSIIPIKSLYIIKISVKQGNPSRLYTVLNSFSGYEEVCFRTENQVLTYKQMSQGFRFLQDRLKLEKQLESHFPHENPCSLERQKICFQATLKKHQKKEFKTNTILESQKTFDKNSNNQKKVIKISGQLTQNEADQLKQFLSQIDQQNSKTDTCQKDSGGKEVQRFTSSTSPFLFKQVNKQDEDATEPINY